MIGKPAVEVLRVAAQLLDETRERGDPEPPEGHAAFIGELIEVAGALP